MSRSLVVFLLIQVCWKVTLAGTLPNCVSDNDSLVVWNTACEISTSTVISSLNISGESEVFIFSDNTIKITILNAFYMLKGSLITCGGDSTIHVGELSALATTVELNGTIQGCLDFYVHAEAITLYDGQVLLNNRIPQQNSTISLISRSNVDFVNAIVSSAYVDIVAAQDVSISADTIISTTSPPGVDVFGAMTFPTLPGSAGNYTEDPQHGYAGGVVYIECVSITVDGRISSDGNGAADVVGGSGGSVLIIANDTLAGSGTISSNGAIQTGKGGPIALYYSIYEFTGTISAIGVFGVSGPGTIYKNQHVSSFANYSSILVDAKGYFATTFYESNNVVAVDEVNLIQNAWLTAANGNTTLQIKKLIGDGSGSCLLLGTGNTLIAENATFTNCTLDIQPYATAILPTTLNILKGTHIFVRGRICNTKDAVVQEGGLLQLDSSGSTCGSGDTPGNFNFRTIVVHSGATVWVGERVATLPTICAYSGAIVSRYNETQQNVDTITPIAYILLNSSGPVPQECSAPFPVVTYLLTSNYYSIFIQFFWNTSEAGVQLDILNTSGGWQNIYKGSNSSFTVTGLKPNTQYQFRLAGTNIAGMSNFIFFNGTTITHWCGDGICTERANESCSTCFFDCPCAYTCPGTPRECSGLGTCKMGACSCASGFCGETCNILSGVARLPFTLDFDPSLPLLSILVNGSLQCNFSYTYISEVDIFGNTVKYYHISTLGFTRIILDEKFFSYNTTISGASIIMIFDYSTVISSMDGFVIPSTAVLFAVLIDNWNFSYITNKLQIGVKYVSINTTSYTVDNVSNTLHSAKVVYNNCSLYYAFLNTAYTDKEVRPIQWLFNNITNDITLTLPNFQNSASFFFVMEVLNTTQVIHTISPTTTSTTTTTTSTSVPSPPSPSPSPSSSPFSLPSTPSPAPVSTDTKKNTIIGTIFGVAVLVVAAILIYLFVKRRRQLQEVELEDLHFDKQDTEDYTTVNASLLPSSTSLSSSPSPSPYSLPQSAQSILSFKTTTTETLTSISPSLSSPSPHPPEVDQLLGYDEQQEKYIREKKRAKLLQELTTQLKHSSPAPLLQYSDLKFIHKIGEGSSGKVFKGLYKDIVVAIKVLKTKHHQDEEDVAREFIKEFEIMSAVRTKHTVHFYGAVLDRKICMVMEYCARETLYHVMNHAQYSMPWDKVFHYATEITTAIKVLHSMNPQVIHRDVKSLNFLVNEYFEIKVCDFGLSRFNTTSNLSTLQRLCGTYAYCAPEVYNTHLYSTKSDVYSLGIVFWELITRCILGHYKPPYKDCNFVFDIQIIIQVSQHGLRPRIPDSCPQGWKTLITSCVDANPLRRPDCDVILATITNLFSEYCANKSAWEATIIQP